MRLGNVVTALVITLLCGRPETAAGGSAEATLEVLTFNVWHGRRSGESKKRFPGEETDRAAKRFEWQIEEIKRLDPDVLLLQEINPNQREARHYAEALGYDEIHKVTSCGLHLGKVYKIPKNVNEGLAILARPELGLRRIGKKRLSGNAACSATWGFQTKESRYVLFGEITLGDRKLMVVTTHLSSPPYVPPGFEEAIANMVDDGSLELAQRDEITEILERKRERNYREAEKLLARIERRSAKKSMPVVLGGDFNTEPETETIALIERHLQNSAVGEEFLTWDPVTNHVNHEIGTKRADPVPTFDKQELKDLLEPRKKTARQIDFVFASAELEVLSAEMVLSRERDGIYPSDHFGVLTLLRISPE